MDNPATKSMPAAQPFLLPQLSRAQGRFIKSLRHKKHRQQARAFVVEGAKGVAQLLAGRHPVRWLVGTGAFLAAHRGLWQQRVGQVFRATEGQLAGLGTLVTNGAAVAVAPFLPWPVARPEVVWGLVLDGVRDPGNLGTLVRTAAWYGIPALICSPSTVDVYNPKVLQASVGAFLHVPVHYTPLPAFLQRTPWPVLGACTTGSPLRHTALPWPGCIVVGNEARGISPAVLAYVQQRVTIPRYGPAESLNAAVAAAVVCDQWRAGKC